MQTQLPLQLNKLRLEDGPWRGPGYNAVNKWRSENWKESGLSTPWSGDENLQTEKRSSQRARAPLLSPTLGDGLKGEGTQ